MTKWVTILLLLLAILAYGLSQMRPVPQDGPASATATPDVVATATPSGGDEPTPSVVATTDPRVRPKSPNFGLPPGATPDSTATPGMIAGTKTDPFSAKKTPDPVAGTIKATVFSESTGLAAPARTKFASTTPAIYLTATPEGLDDQVEVVASYRSVLDESAPFSQPVTSSGPPRKRSFRLSAPADGWKPGPYQVVLKAKATDQVLGIDRFEILKPDQQVAQTMPQAEYMDLVPDLVTETAQTSFKSTDQKILLRVSAHELPSGTNIRTVWSAVEVDRLTSGELIAVSNQPAPGKENDAVFTYEAPPGGYHPGTYKVDIYFDQVLADSQAFFIEPPPAPKTNSR